MKKLLIVTCTKAKTESEFQDRPIYKSLKKQYELNSPHVDMHIFKDNKRGLSECYNEVLNTTSYSDKIALFVHDDVELEDIFLYEKLANSPYSVTGLAGAKSFNKQSSKLAWHLSSPREDYVGEVAHKSKDGSIWTTVFGNTNSRALVLDGLFIACNIANVKEKGLEFDINFNFHFYDIAFCLRANESKVPCGVLPIRAIHHGLGDSMLTPEWDQANLKFKEVYCK
jgi:hypothetical protein